MDRLEAMALLLDAVEGGSLSGAGRRRGMPLATISRKLSDLEAHLGTRLLNRSARGLTLTDAGRSYVAACRRILDDVGEAERAAAGEYRSPKGDLAVTAPIVFGRMHVLPAVSEFLRAYPEIDIRLVLADRIVDLSEERIDVAVRIGALPDSSLVAIRLGSIRPVVCASPAYLAAHGVPRTLEELGTHDCVTFEGLASPGVWTFGSGKSQVSIRIRSRLAVNTADAAIDAALAGAGLTRVLSYQIASARNDGLLRIVLQRFEPLPWPVSLVYPGQGLLPLKVRAFLDFVAPRLKERVARDAA